MNCFPVEQNMPCSFDSRELRPSFFCCNKIGFIFEFIGLLPVFATLAFNHAET